MMSSLTKMAFLLSLFGGVTFAWVSCSPNNSDGDGDGDSDGDSDSDGDGDSDFESDCTDGLDNDGDALADCMDPDCASDPDCGTDADNDWDDTCDSQQFSISTQPPNVMILLDQSSSMVESTWGGHSHWQETIDGITALLEDPRVAEFSFGLDPFPDGDLAYLERCYDECCRDPACLITQARRCINMSLGCGRSCAVDLPPFVPMGLAPDVATPIIDYVNLLWVPTTFGNTPIAEQLRYYNTDRSSEMPEFYANDGTAYLVVISDGDDTCEDGADEPDVGMIVSNLTTVTSQLVENHGIRTFAIGFGDTSGDMARELNAIAAAGGTDFTTFFPITTDGGLAEAFGRISTSIISCEYAIDDVDATADPEAVNFYFDEEPIGYDPTCTAGWRWTDDAHNRVEFCGAQCEALKNGDVSEIEARFGCATILW